MKPDQVADYFSVFRSFIEASVTLTGNEASMSNIGNELQSFEMEFNQENGFDQIQPLNPYHSLKGVHPSINNTNKRIPHHQTTNQREKQDPNLQKSPKIANKLKKDEFLKNKENEQLQTDRSDII